VSNAVNSVRNGRLWCVVKKPGETVIHSGTLEDDHTIVWQSSRDDPLRIEYFRESVEGDLYTVRGWGYYGGDDPGLTPRTWFRGDYRRVR
jgi:hypothetical protein